MISKLLDPLAALKPQSYIPYQCLSFISMSKINEKEFICLMYQRKEFFNELYIITYNKHLFLAKQVKYYLL